MATISTFTNLNGAVLALDAVYQKLYYIERAVALLQGIENGSIKDDAELGAISFATLAIESLTGAMAGIYGYCESIEDYLVSIGGEHFRALVENAELVKQATDAQDTPEGRAQS
ncbi:MAG: hypothetical protein K1563_07835 [Candidatus Thiodiazotropha sp. (ex. Lucinisca nassula)]|nr:hypothetical protein [Candidatus Thiodiazotropha sp. (ex. Lucinisca nassula)]MBW9273584.1 hypothetical protein [Candidatus Thiodiazotropha sp. (ex. Lucinisca nassula)]